MLQGKITISRTRSTAHPDVIRIEIVDEKSGCIAFEVEMGIEEFGSTVTGQGYMPCNFFLNESGVIGKKREAKHEVLTRPLINSADPSMEMYKRDVLSAYEIDGWEARKEDLSNFHNYTDDGKVSVLFERYVADEEAE